MGRKWNRYKTTTTRTGSSGGNPQCPAINEVYKERWEWEVHKLKWQNNYIVEILNQCLGMHLCEAYKKKGETRRKWEVETKQDWNKRNIHKPSTTPYPVRISRTDSCNEVTLSLASLSTCTALYVRERQSHTRTLESYDPAHSVRHTHKDHTPTVNAYCHIL